MPSCSERTTGRPTHGAQNARSSKG